MNNNLFKYSILSVIVIFTGYHSIYFEKLSEVKAGGDANEFDAASYAETFWNNSLIPILPEAIDIYDLVDQLESNPEQVIKEHSHSLGIGNLKYFLIEGKGIVKAINENDIELINDQAPSQKVIQLETEFVYGNAVRDAVGLIDLSEFPNTMHLNQVSQELNKKIRTEVIPQFLEHVRVGDRVKFVGAIELNQKYLDLDRIPVIPVSLNIEKD